MYGDRVYVEDMYNEDGSFQPLTASHGNINGELAHYRNTYMEAEREYFKELLSIKTIYNEFIKFINYNSGVLFDEAIKIQTLLEYGILETPEELEMMKTMTPQERDSFHMRKLEEAEGLMCLYFAAARDKALILELVKTYTPGERYGSRR